MPKVSVIIPVYNVEKYLCRCLDSVLAQTFCDFEVLVVDDGSTDGSENICDEYAKKDARIRVFHKENGGVSSARNLGLDEAMGEWVCFVDSDDWICKDYLEQMMPFRDEDFIMESARTNGEPLSDGVFRTKELGNNIPGCCTQINSPWGKLLRLGIIRNNNLHFDERISYGEDTLFIVEYCSFIKSIRISSQRRYNYTPQVVGSLSTKSVGYNIAAYTFTRLAIANHKLAVSCNNKQIEERLATHSGIYLEFMTCHLHKCSMKERAKLIRNFFKTGEVNTAMYHVGRRFRPFTWCGIRGFYKLAAILLPPI